MAKLSMGRVIGASILAFLSLAMSCLITQPAWAQVTRGNKKITIQQKWPSAGFGYYRLKARVSESPLNAVAVAERFYLVARNGGNYNSDQLIASKAFTLEAGDSFVDVEIYLPVQSQWDSRIELHIERDGNLRRDRHDLFSEVVQIPYFYGGNAVTMLVVTSKLIQPEKKSTIVTRKLQRVPQQESGVVIHDQLFPSVQEIEGVFAISQNQFGMQAPTQPNSGTASAVLAQTSSLHAILPEDLPKSWLGLTTIEFVVISNTDFQDVVKNYPESHQALVQWVAAGGTLIVNGCGAQFQAADKIRRQVPLRQDRNVGLKSPWLYPTSRQLSQARLNRGSQQQPNFGAGEIPDSSIGFYRSESSRFHTLPAETDLGDLAGGDLPNQKFLNSPEGFLLFEHLQGRVVCVKDLMLKWKNGEWVDLLGTCQSNGRSIPQRIGLANSTGPKDFNIPGVGQPPVLAFQVLLCLFIIIVGPVAYILLSRKKRLQLMFVLVPALSLLVCVALLLYAVFSEGLQTRGRIKSFTVIDHATNQAVSHVRHSHYAGTQPAAYRFSATDFVMGSESGRRRDFVYSQDELAVSGGNIRSRTPHQVTAVQVYETTARLALVSSKEGQLPRVENRFAQTILLGYFRTESGLYLVTDLGPGEIMEGELATDLSTEERISQIYQELSPKVVDKFADRDNRNRYSPYYGNNYQNGEFDADCDYLLDTVLSKSDEVLSEENTYLAVFGNLDLIRKPLPKVEYKHRIDVVRGKW